MYVLQNSLFSFLVKTLAFGMVRAFLLRAHSRSIILALWCRQENDDDEFTEVDKQTRKSFLFFCTRLKRYQLVFFQLSLCLQLLN